MNQTIQSAVASTRRFRDPLAWRFGIWKSALHSATGSVLGAAGTNSVEGLSPAFLQPYTAGVGMDFRQMAAMFAVFLFIGAVRYVHEATKPGNTAYPFTK